MTHARHRAGAERSPFSKPTPSGGAIALRRGAKVLVALVSATLLLAMGYYRYTYASLNNGLHRVDALGLGPSTSPNGTVSHVDGSAQNLLIIGSDSRSGLTAAQAKQLHVGSGSSVDQTTSTDTLMVVHVPADGSKATLISIPRDSYVAIPGFGHWKINAAYIDGYNNGTQGVPVTSSSSPAQREKAGMTLLIRTVKNLTGLEIDHYAMVSFEGFYNIAKAIGGITVDLCHATNDTSAHNVAEGNGPVGSGFVMSGGVHDLTPVQALEFVRQRHNLYDSHGNQLNDEGREARQRYFIAAAFKRIASGDLLVNPGKLNSLVGAVKQTLTLDGTLSLSDLAKQMSDLSSGRIAGNTIPTEGTQDIQGPGSSLIVDPAKVQKWIAALLNPTHSAPTTHAPTAPRTGTSTSASSSAPAPTAAAKGCIN